MIGDNMYLGIRVKVSFSGHEYLHNEVLADKDYIVTQNQEEVDSQGTTHLGHLSGGQKAVVAACLIFSI